MKSKFPVIVVLQTAFLAGTLDIAAAFLNSYIRSGTSPVVILQFIASGVFGNSSFEGGLLYALFGVIFHYFIAFSWTAIFFMVFPKLNISPKFKVISGLLYGIIIWLIMNLIVIPLSNTPSYSPGIVQLLLGICFLMFLIGLPVSLMFHKNYKLER